MYAYKTLCKPSRFTTFFLSLLLILTIIFSSTVHIYADQSDLPGTGAEPTVYTSNVTHKHTGNATDGGGCYSKSKRNVRVIEEPCHGTMVYYPEYDRSQCDFCGAGYAGDESYRDCWTIFTHDEVYYTYELGCGFANNSTIGKLSAVCNQNDWQKEVTVNLDVTPMSIASGSDPFLVNNSRISGNSVTLTENGTYTFSFKAIKNSHFTPITIEISNIDTTAPTVTIDYDRTPDIPKTDIHVSVTDSQPDGTPGSGLSQEPYSYDGGNTWTSEDTHEVNDNGSITVVVRDAAGNETSQTIEISNIKHPEPTPEADPDADDNGGSGNNGGSGTGDNGSGGTGDNGGGGSGSNGNGDNNDNVSDSGDNGTPDAAVSDNTNGNGTGDKPANPGKPGGNKPFSKPDTENSDVGSDGPIKPKTYTDYVSVTETGIKKSVVPKQQSVIRKTISQPTAAAQSSVEVKEKLSDEELMQIILACALGAVALAVITGFLILFLNRVTIVKNLSEGSKYRLIGLTNIKSRGDVFEINISKELYDKCDTCSLRLKLPAVFASSHKEDTLNVYLPGSQCHSVKPKRTLDITMKSHI